MLEPQNAAAAPMPASDGATPFGCFSQQSDAWWGPFLGTVGSLDTPRRKARRAYARTILHAYRSFAREAPTRGLTDAVLQRVRDAGLPTMNVGQMYNYATSNKFPELP